MLCYIMYTVYGRILTCFLKGLNNMKNSMVIGLFLIVAARSDGVNGLTHHTRHLYKCILQIKQLGNA